MKSLNEIKRDMAYMQNDENFINYLKILNLNGVIVFNDSDISEVDGELFAERHLYDQLIAVYGDHTEMEGVEIG
jgi:hypothetical protein